MSKITINLDINEYQESEKLIITFLDGEVLECEYKDVSNYNLLVTVGDKELLLMKHALKYVEIIKPTIEKIKLSDINISSTMKKKTIDQGIIDSIKAAYNKGWLKPITIKYNNEGTPILKDGYKRYLALKEIGIEDIKVKVEGK